MPLKHLALAASIVSAPIALAAQTRTTRPLSNPLTSTAGLELLNVKAETVTYRGRQALHVVGQGGGTELVIVTGSELSEGTIELDVAGAPAAGAAEGARGFVGVAFHVQPAASRFRAFYLRPTNGRADDQLRRNHATQFINEPDYPWQRLRKDEPGVYESYVDLEPGVWTRIRVEVSAKQARLFVNGTEQPTLIINDQKPGEANGKVALWIGLGTDAHFANLTIR